MIMREIFVKLKLNLKTLVNSYTSENIVQKLEVIQGGNTFHRFEDMLVCKKNCSTENEKRKENK